MLIATLSSSSSTHLTAGSVSFQPDCPTLVVPPASPSIMSSMPSFGHPPVTLASGISSIVFSNITSSKDKQCNRQIRACLLVDDYIWSSFTCLRTDPKAADFLQELHLSTICFIPPDEIFDIILLMRLHPDWTAVRDIVTANLTQPKHLSMSTASTRSSALSSRSLTRLSSTSARSYATNATGHTFADIAEENMKEEDTKVHPARSETIRGPPPIASNSKKTSRRAPSTDRFVCPYPHHRGNHVFITVGNFERHIRADHPGTPWLDAYKFPKT